MPQATLEAHAETTFILSRADSEYDTCACSLTKQHTKQHCKFAMQQLVNKTDSKDDVEPMPRPGADEGALMEQFASGYTCAIFLRPWLLQAVI
jgi:hypothetical protein